MAAKSISLNFQSDISVVKSVSSAIMAFIEKEVPCISEADLFELKVIYSELILNAIIHGNDQNPNKTVALRVRVDDGRIFSTIKDEGGGFDYESLLVSRSYLNTLMLEKGRGLMMVNALVDSLSFNNTGTEIEFLKIVS